MSTLQIALVLAVVVLLLTWLWLRQRGAGGDADEPADRIDTLTGWPPTATRVLSSSERIALATLLRALPEYMVLAQVPMARFVSVPKRNSYADWLRRVGYQCVDFVVCDMRAQVVAVVELQAPHPSELARKRLTRMSRTLRAAQIPLQVWREDALPSLEVAREVILSRPVPVPALGKPPVAGAAGGAAAAPVAAARASNLNPFDDSSRDSTQDETIEVLAPPPSTWFDEIDSDPVPLNKR